MVLLSEEAMDEGEFAVWLDGMARLSAAQRALAKARLEAPAVADRVVDGGPEPAPTIQRKRRRAGSGEADALGEVETLKVANACCPHCGAFGIAPWGWSHGLRRYRCADCRRTFNAATRTPMARLRKREGWMTQAQALIEGVSLAKAAERCGVHPTTAFRWRHRFLTAPALDKPLALKGIVEADETFILESFKGRRSDLPRPARRRGGGAKHPGLFFENIPVLVARDREGATIDAVLPEDTAACVAAGLKDAVTSANQLVCDGGMAIRAFARRRRIPVHVVPSPGKPDIAAPDMHLNNVNAYHSRLKEWLRPFHGVATKNLPNYLGWRRAIEAWGNKITPQNWLLGALGSGPYQQLTL